MLFRSHAFWKKLLAISIVTGALGGCLHLPSAKTDPVSAKKEMLWTQWHVIVKNAAGCFLTESSAMHLLTGHQVGHTGI